MIHRGHLGGVMARRSIEYSKTVTVVFSAKGLSKLYSSSPTESMKSLNLTFGIF